MLDIVPLESTILLHIEINGHSVLRALQLGLLTHYLGLLQVLLSIYRCRRLFPHLHVLVLQVDQVCH